MRENNVIVDGIPYVVSLESNLVTFAGTEKLDKYVFIKSASHRHNVFDSAQVGRGRAMVSFVDFCGTMYALRVDGSINKQTKAEATIAMNKVATDTQQIDSEIAALEAQLAQKRQQKEQQAAQVQQEQVIAPAPVQQPMVAPAPGVAMSPIASAVYILFRTAGIDNSAPEAKAISTTLSNLGDKDPNKIPDILQLLDTARLEFEQITKSAGENPFAKKDEDKDEDKAEDKGEEKSEDKKPAPFEKKDDSKEEKKDDKPEAKKEEKSEPKKDDKAEPKNDSPKSDEKSDEVGAKKAIEIVEKLLEKEMSHGEPAPHIEHLKESLDQIKKFLFEEEGEKNGIPGMSDMMSEPKMPGMPGLDMKDPKKDEIIKTGPAVPLPKNDGHKELGLSPVPELPAGMKPIHPIKPMVENSTVGTSAFAVNDPVWPRTAGEDYTIGDEPGRIIAIANNKIIVDWGTDAPTEEIEADLIKAAEPTITESFFQNPKDAEEPMEMGLNAFTPASQEVQKALASLSFADVMAKHAEEMDSKGTVYHIGTNQKGKIISAGTGGRLIVQFGDKTTEVWPFEIVTNED